MGNHEPAKEMLLAQMRERQKNPDKNDNPRDKKNNLLNRVGKGILKIAQAPVHVVYGALEATGNALQGRFDKSVGSLAGGIGKGFGSLHNGIREMPLVGDAVTRLEKFATDTNEKIGFIGEEKSELDTAEERLKQAIDGLLKPLSTKTDDELKQEAEELQKKILEEAKKNNPQSYKEITGEGYAALKKNVPGLPPFLTLNPNQKEMLQVMYFGRRDPKPDLENSKVCEYLEKLVAAGASDTTHAQQLEYSIYSAENFKDAKDLFHFTPLEINCMEYILNLAERVRRIQASNAEKRQTFSGADLTLVNTVNSFTRLFGNAHGVSGGH